MSTQSYEQLIAGANKIRENELPESNTHTLVGEHMLQMVNKQQEADDQCKSEVYNVSRYHTQVDGSRIFTLAQAIDVVPARLRISGAVIKYKNSTKEVIAFFDGDIANWSNVNLWRTVIDNKDFEYAEKTGNKDQPGGYAGLDENGLVPTSSLSPNPLETESKNIVGAINELQTGKVDSESIVQELGDSDKLVLSQKGAKELLQDRKEKDAAGGYAGLDDEGKLDNRKLRKANGYLFKSGTYANLSPQIDFSTSDFAIETIFNQKTASQFWLFLQQTGSVYFGIYIKTDNGLITYPGGDIATQNIIKLNTNNHLIYTKTGDVFSTYLNGQKVSEVTRTGSVYPGQNEPLVLAKYAQAASSLEISLFRVFNRGFNQNDIDYYYNNNTPDKSRLSYSDTNITTTELVAGGNFENVLIGSKIDSGSVSTWTLNTLNPISGTNDGRLVVTSGGVQGAYAQVFFTAVSSLLAGKTYLLKVSYKVNSGDISLVQSSNGQSRIKPYRDTGTELLFLVTRADTYNGLALIIETYNNLIDVQFDNISIKQVGSVLELLPENATSNIWYGTQQGINGITVGGPILNFGHFYKKVESSMAIPSVFSFKREGDGSGVAYIRVTADESQIATIIGGIFVKSFSDLTEIGEEQLCPKNVDTYLYFKSTDDYGDIILHNVSKLSTANRIANGPTMYTKSVNLPAYKYFDGAAVVYAVSGDLSKLPRTLELITAMSSSVALSGDISELPKSLKECRIGGTGELTGDIRYLSKKITALRFDSSNTKVSGDINTLSSGLSILGIQGSNTVKGDIGLIKGHLSYLNITGLNTVVYNNRANIFSTSLDTVNIRPGTAGVFTSTMVDNMFIDINTYVTSAIGSKTIDFRGNCGAPTSESLTARTELANKGFTIYTN